MPKKVVTLFCAVAMAFYLAGCAAVTVPVFEYNCLGKNRTCPAKQSSALDFFCAACDPDHDNIEGIKKNTSSTDYVPGSAVDTEDASTESSDSAESSDSPAAAEPSVDSEADSEDPSEEAQEKIDIPTTLELMALRQAKSYLSSPISRAALIAQLKADGFSSEEAAYAAKNCDADWNKQAEKAAKNHLARYPVYLSLLVKQLELDGFTTDEALHGATAAYNAPLSMYPSLHIEPRLP